MGVARADGSSIAHDDMASALPVDLAQPLWNAWTDFSGATVEPGEPQDCVATPAAAERVGTVWYKLTPVESVMVGVYLQSAPNLTGAALGAGLYRQQGSAQAFVACAEETWTRFTLEPGEGYLLQFSGVCLPLCNPAGGIDIVAVPSHDTKARAQTIAVPFAGRTALEFATMGAEEPTECVSRYPWVFRPTDEAQSVWYRYTAPRDDVLKTWTNRMFLGVQLGAFEETPAGLVLVACDELDPEYDFGDQRTSLVPVKAGHTYLFQISSTDHGPYWADFELDRAPHIDGAITHITVEDTDARYRAIDFNLSFDEENVPREAFLLEVVACPVTHPSQCGVIYREGQGSFRDWDTTGCVGDVIVEARLVPWYGVDPDLTNNVARQTVNVQPGPHGVGVGACSGLLN